MCFICSFFFMRLTWASRTHDGKDTFFIIFLCLRSFSTICVCWLKYTTHAVVVPWMTQGKCVAVVVTGKKSMSLFLFLKLGRKTDGKIQFFNHFFLNSSFCVGNYNNKPLKVRKNDFIIATNSWSTSIVNKP